MSLAGKEISLRLATEPTVLFVAVAVLFFILLVWLHVLIFRPGRHLRVVPRAESPPILRALPGTGAPVATGQTENPGSEPWPGDGGGEGAGSREGGQRGPSTADAGGEDFDPADLEDLLAAVEEDEQ